MGEKYGNIYFSIKILKLAKSISTSPRQKIVQLVPSLPAALVSNSSQTTCCSTVFIVPGKHFRGTWCASLSFSRVATLDITRPSVRTGHGGSSVSAINGRMSREDEEQPGQTFSSVECTGFAMANMPRTSTWLEPSRENCRPLSSPVAKPLMTLYAT